MENEQKEIIGYPPTKTLTPPQKELLWRFRFFLSKDKHVIIIHLSFIIYYLISYYYYYYYYY